MMAQIHRLGTLQVGVARQRPVEVLLRAGSKTPISFPIAARATAARSRVNIARSVTTWSLRERAVCRRPPTGPTSSVRRRSTAMWMSSSSGANGKRPSLQLELDCVETTQQRVAILDGEDPPLGQHPRVRARLREILRPQPPVEVDRGVQALEVRVLGFAEAGQEGPESTVDLPAMNSSCLSNDSFSNLYSA